MQTDFPLPPDLPRPVDDGTAQKTAILRKPMLFIMEWRKDERDKNKQ